MSQPQQRQDGYSPVPKKRRGNRRASNNSPFKDELEPKLGLFPEAAPAKEPEDERGRWIKEQLPPHWG